MALFAAYAVPNAGKRCCKRGNPAAHGKPEQSASHNVVGLRESPCHNRECNGGP
jgi:hypothetical protein